MKIKLRKRLIIVAVVNAVMLVTAIILNVFGDSLAEKQTYNYSAERWKGQSKENFTQISCFFPESSHFDISSVASARTQMLYSLKNVSITAKRGRKLCPDAYSVSLGQAEIKSDINRQSDAEVTAAGGDFFLFRNFKLIDGAYFSEEDIADDLAVIDRNLAWKLYGSHDVAGMNLKINGVEFYICGVIENPQTKEEKDCSGELPKIYISYKGAGRIPLNGNIGVADSVRLTKVTCYEFIMPEPVENFAYNSMEGYFHGVDKDAMVITNTGRFEASLRTKAIVNFRDYAVIDRGVKLPYWENASRITEFRLSIIYFLRNLCFVFPVITALWLIIKAYRTINRSRKRIAESAIGGISALRSRFLCKSEDK